MMHTAKKQLNLEVLSSVGLSGVYDLDKWRGAGIPNCEVGKPALYP